MIRKAMRRAWALYKEKFGLLLGAELLQTVLTLIVLAPLIFLFVQELRPLSLLTVPLFLLILLPMRQNEARLLADLDAGRETGLWQIVSGYRYGTKLARGVKTTLLMLLWGCAFLAATGLVLYYYKAQGVEGSTDFLTVLRTITALGGGKIDRGAVRAILIYLATLIPVLLGLAFHSGTRHAYTNNGGRKTLKGHRLAVIGMWFVSLVTMLPFAAVAAFTSMNYVGRLREALAQFNLSGKMSIPMPDQGALVIAAAFVVLVLPLLPLKKLMTACRVHMMAKPDDAHEA